MGEIADAIRRARSRRPDGRGELKLPGLLRAAPTPGPDAPPPLPPSSRSEHWVEGVQPLSPAIVLEDGANAEACRHVALRLRSQLEARGAHSVAIVSALRNEGKTTVVCDLGIALASLSRGREVALVDLDLRKPSLAHYLSLPREVGVEDVLLERATLDEVRIAVQQPALDIYPAVVNQRSAHELMVRASLGEMVAELERRYSVVLVDTPPTLAVPDTNLILRHVAACVPIARVGWTRLRQFRNLVDNLPRGQILGQVLNDARASHFGDYYPYIYGDETGESTKRRKRSESA